MPAGWVTDLQLYAGNHLLRLTQMRSHRRRLHFTVTEWPTRIVDTHPSVWCVLDNDGETVATRWRLEDAIDHVCWRLFHAGG